MEPGSTEHHKLSEYQQYRDRLADRLRAIRDGKFAGGSDEESRRVGKEQAREVLDKEKATRIYQITERLARDAAKAKQEGKLEEGVFPFETANEYFEQLGMPLELGPSIDSIQPDEKTYYTGTYNSVQPLLKHINGALPAGDHQWRLPTPEEGARMVEPMRALYEHFKEIETTADPSEVAETLREYYTTLEGVKNVLCPKDIKMHSWMWTPNPETPDYQNFESSVSLATGERMGTEKSLWGGQGEPLSAILVRELKTDTQPEG